MNSNSNRISIWTFDSLAWQSTRIKPLWLRHWDQELYEFVCIIFMKVVIATVKSWSFFSVGRTDGSWLIMNGTIDLHWSVEPNNSNLVMNATVLANFYLLKNGIIRVRISNPTHTKSQNHKFGSLLVSNIATIYTPASAFTTFGKTWYLLFIIIMTVIIIRHLQNSGRLVWAFLSCSLR